MARAGKREAIPETVEESYRRLQARAKEAGIERYLEKYATQWKPYREEAVKIFREHASAHYSQIDEDFVVYREMIAQVVKRHLYWFIRWMTPEKERDRVERIHFVICDFLERGLVAIPDEWRYAGEFFDRRRFIERGTTDLLGVPYLLDVTPQIIMMPRGLGKSHCFTILDAIRQVAIDPSSKWFIGQGTLPLAQQLVGAMKRALETQYLSLLMPDVFCPTKKEYLSRGGRWTTNLVDIIQIDNDDINLRQENTFTAVSLGSATTGSHPNGGFYDDLDNKDSTITAQAANETETFWRNQSALGNKPARFFQRLTDTFWYEDGLTQRCKMDSTYFRMPSDWWHEGERKVISHFYVPFELLDDLKKGWKEFGDAHSCIAPVPRSGGFLEVGFDRKKHTRIVTPQELKELKDTCIVVSVGDPAYSDKHKRLGDARSRATILHALRAENGWTGIFDVWQTGGLDIDRWRERAVYETKEKGTDIWIQDSQGTQFGHFENAARAIREESMNRIKTVMHRKPLGNKLAVANEILKDLFAGGEINVLLVNEGDQPKRMQSVIDQLLGLNRGMDIVDCLVYMIDDVDISRDFRTAMLRRKIAADRKNATGKEPPLLRSRFAMNPQNAKTAKKRW